MKIDVLGTKYKIIYEEMGNAGYDGFCDNTSKEIHLRTDNVNNVGDFKELMTKNARHEIIHAFMSESGLQANWEHPQYGHDETTVDWMAIMFPKLIKAFKKAKCL